MKIAICTPTFGFPTAPYTGSLFNLQACTMQLRPDLMLRYISSCGHLIGARNQCLQMALDAEADRILWVDDDMMFPPDALLRLLQHDRPVVGCSYPKRGPPHEPTAFGKSGPVYPDPRKVAARVLEPVTFLGLGFCLVSSAVVRRLPKDPFQPHPRSPHGLWEDVKFFEDIRALGEEVYLDHALSEAIGHVGQAVFTLKDTQR